MLFGKIEINTFYFSYDEFVGQTDFFSLDMVTSLGEGTQNSNELYLKIGLVSYSAHGGDFWWIHSPEIWRRRWKKSKKIVDSQAMIRHLWSKKSKNILIKYSSKLQVLFLCYFCYCLFCFFFFFLFTFVFVFLFLIIFSAFCYLAVGDIFV